MSLPLSPQIAPLHKKQGVSVLAQCLVKSLGSYNGTALPPPVSMHVPEPDHLDYGFLLRMNERREVCVNQDRNVSCKYTARVDPRPLSIYRVLQAVGEFFAEDRKDPGRDNRASAS